MVKKDLESYKKYVAKHINQLTSITRRYTQGDFSQNIALPKGKNEFTDLFIDLNMMVDTVKEMVDKKESDIRQLKIREAEKELRNENDKLQKYLDIAGVMFVALNEKGEITLINQRGIEVLGYEQEEIIGKNWFDNFLPSSMKEEVKTVYNRLMIGEIEPVQFYENTVLTKGGEERIIAWHNALLKNKKGNIIGTLSSGENITERKQVEESLRLKNLVFDASIAANSIADLNGVITEANNMFLRVWGYPSKEEVIGKPLIDFLNDPDEAVAIITALNDISEWEGDYTGKRKDGSTFIAHGLATVVRDENGQLIGYQSAVMDVTENKQAEEEIHRSKQQIEMLITSSSVMLYACKALGDFDAVFISDNIYNITGYTNNEFLSKGFWASHIHPDDAPKAFENLGNLFEHNYHSHEYRFLFKDGTYHWMYDELKLTRDVSGNPLEILGTWSDITDRKLVDEEIKLSENKYHALFDTLSDAAFLIDRETGKIIDVNAAATKIYGYTRNEWLKMKNTDLSAEPQKTKKATKNLPDQIPVRYHLKKDGTIFPVEMILGAFIYKDRNVVFATSRDITERKQADEALTEREKRFRTLYENVTESIFYLNVEAKDKYRFQSVNPAFLKATGLKANQVVGKLVSEIIPEPSLSLVLSNYRKAIQKKKSVHWEEETPYPTGKKVGDVTITPIFNEQGICTNLIGTVYDITERKSAEEALRETSDRLIEAQTVSHLGSWEWDPVKDEITGSEEFYRLFESASDKSDLAKFEQFIEKLHPDDIEKVQQDVAESLKQKRQYNTEYRVKLSNGNWRNINARGQVFTDADGKSVRMIGTCLDITERTQAETELNRQREMLQRIFDNIPVMITYFDDTGKINMINNELVKKLGWTFEDWQTENIFAKCYPDPVAFKEILDFMMSKPTSWKDCRTTTKYGTVIDTSWTNVSLSDGFSLGIGQDITERKRAEEALRINQERLFFATEGSNLGIWNWNILTGELIWSDKCKSLFGVPADETMSYQRFSEALHPDDRERTDQAVQDALDNHKDFDIEYRSLWPDGSIHWLAAKGRGFYNEAGNAARLEGIVLDISEKKRAEENLRNSENRYRSLISNSPVSLWEEDWSEVIDMVEKIKQDGVTDFETFFNSNPDFVNEALAKAKILDVNNETLIMFKAGNKSQMLDSLSVVFATDDSLPGFIGELIALASGELLYETEMSLNTVDGKLINTFLRMNFPGKDAQSGQVLVSIMDITEIKKAQEAIRKLNEDLEKRVSERTAELQTANKELESFSYSVSHDLRAPIRAIDGFTRILSEDYKAVLDDEGKRLLEVVLKNTKNMGQLIDDLLAFSRMSRKKVESELVQMDALVKEVAEELRDFDKDRKLKISIKNLSSVNGDRALLRQVIINLLSNAIKFTRPKDTAVIEIGNLKKDHQNIYYIKDNGVGFDMKYVHKIFDVFQRLHTTKEFKGTGVGLAIVQKIIQRHGGKIWAEAKLSKGATFYFSLPKNGDKK